MSRTFVIGDVHGEIGMLRDVMRQINAEMTPGDTLVFLGDLIDRGPSSRSVVEYVMALARGHWEGDCVVLLGNHEDMLLDHVRREAGTPCLYDAGLWECNGGCETVQSYLGEDQYDSLMREFRKLDSPEERCWVALHKYGVQNLLLSEHLSFFTQCPLSYEDEHGIYVHAGLPPGKTLAQAGRFERLWVRDVFIYSRYDWGKPVVFGHTPQHDGELLATTGRRVFQPRNDPNKIGLDTGSCYGGYLSAVMLPERKFFRSAKQGKKHGQ